MSDIKIAPSILSGDFSQIGKEISDISDAGADYIHLDVMDGVFVNNISFGPKFIKDSRRYSKKVFDAHLMIVEPWKYVDRFADAGADIITVHKEACGDRLIETLKQIKSLGVKCGAVINPDTDAEKVFDAVEYVDMVLVMSVFPGFGGQKFIPDSLKNIEKLRDFAIRNNLNYDVEIDGGITADNACLVKRAGANVIVAGSAIFKEKDRAGIIERLRNS